MAGKVTDGAKNIVEIITTQNVVEIVAADNVVEVVKDTLTTVDSPTSVIEVIQTSNVVEVTSADNKVDVYTTVGLRGPRGATGPIGPTGPISTVPGPIGPTGPTGMRGKYTPSPTPPTAPDLGDAWYNTTNGKTYVWYDTYWVEVGSTAKGDGGATGPQGPEGPTGPQGELGPEGAVGRTPYWYAGHGAPSPLIGMVGDMFIDEIDGSVYGMYTEGVWSGPLLSIAGPQGAEGPTGPSGSGINVTIAAVPPSLSDPGSEGDLWVVV